MPFGLTNAPTTFMDIMKRMLHHYLDQFVIVFIDDILVYSPTTKRHAEHLRMVLQTLREENLFAKFSQFELWRNQVVFLRHIISSEGLKVDSQNWTQLKLGNASKRFLKLEVFFALAGYYRRFLDGFSKLVLPLTTLTKKATKFEWSHDCERSF